MSLRSVSVMRWVPLGGSITRRPAAARRFWKTDGGYFKADNETDLSTIYETLSTKFVSQQEKTEITAFFTAAAAVVLLVAVLLSMLWFKRIP